MSPDRAEIAGTGAAIVFHVALIAALSMSLANATHVPEPPSMEVDLVEDVGLQSTAPSPPTPPPPSQALEMGQAIEPAPPPPVEAPTPAPAIKPAPAPPQKAAPQKPQQAKATPQKQATQRPAPRVSRIGDDFLKGITGSDAPSRPAKPAGATFDAKAKASIAALFQRLVQPCANDQVNPGEGANRIRVTVNLRLRPNGSLAGASVVRVAGVDDENERYVQRVRDLATAVYRDCSPFRGLPPDLYDTPQGGWSNINLTYKLP